MKNQNYLNNPFNPLYPMAAAPNPSTSSNWLFGTTTEEAFAQQEHLLKEEAEVKKQQLKRLQEVQQLLAYNAGQINSATQEAQTYLTKSPIQTRLPNQLSPTKCKDPVRQMEELLTMAQLAKKGEALQKLENHIKNMNDEVGRVQAQALELEEQAKDMDPLIEQFERLIAAKEKTLAQAKQLSANADRMIKNE